MVYTISPYLISNVICGLILVVLSYQLNRQYKLLTDNRYFLEIVMATLIMAVSDVIWSLVEGKSGAVFRGVNIVTNAVYLYQAAVISFIWLMYVIYKVFPKRTKNVYMAICLLSIPAVILFVLVVFSQKYHLIYYVNEMNIYTRGKYREVQSWICLFYIILASVLAFIHAFKQKTKRDRRYYFFHGIFGLAPAVCSYIQVLTYELPFSMIGMAVSILFLYLTVQSKQISDDSLTGVNNRLQFNLYTDSLFSAKKSKKPYYLLMMDVNKFKKINDNFGHFEGDRALVKVADALVEVCDIQNDFVARYGGDEFAVICSRKNEDEIRNLITSINNKVKEFNSPDCDKYDLNLSIGFTLINFENDTPESAIQRADKMMYKEKSKVSGNRV